MAKYKNNLTTKLVNTIADGADKAKSAVSNIANNDVVKGIVKNISPYSKDSGLRGVSTETQGNVDKYSAEYKPSESVAAALDKKNQASNAVTNYGSYNSSYQSQLDDIYNKIMSREDFTYDMNSDVLYNQYKDQYQALGQTAMADTMAQASALTGGYGNSYASTVGNQAYQTYLSQLNDKIPELYQLAQANYNQKTQDLYNQYSLTQSADESAYGRWLDGYNRLVGDRDYYTSDYWNQYNSDYGQFADNRSYWQNQAAAENADYWQNKNFNYGVLSDAVNFGYGAYRDTVSDAWNAANFGYGMYRDAVSDSQWNKTFDYTKERDAVSDSQWQQTFDYGKERDEVADSQWQQSFDYNKYRDDVSDSQWEKTFDYNAGRDAVADSQWQQTFDYNKLRDNVADSQWEKTFNYNAGRDKVADSQWEKEYSLKKADAVSSSSGSSSGGGNTKTPAKQNTTQSSQSTTNTKVKNTHQENLNNIKNQYSGKSMLDLSMELTSSVNSTQAANKIDLWEKAGVIDEAQADTLYELYLSSSKSSNPLFK